MSPPVFMKGYWMFLFLLRMEDRLGIYVGIDYAKSGLYKLPDKPDVKMFVKLHITVEIKNWKTGLYDKKSTFWPIIPRSR